MIEPKSAWSGNQSSDGFIAYAWSGNDKRLYVVAVNYQEHRGQCNLVLPFRELEGKQVRLADMIANESYERDGGELISRGIYIDHAAWQINVFE